MQVHVIALDVAYTGNVQQFAGATEAAVVEKVKAYLDGTPLTDHETQPPKCLYDLGNATTFKELENWFATWLDQYQLAYNELEV
jgi:hypothetical protein